MIQVYKEAFKARASLRARGVAEALIHVYHTS
jgi:hypothetical protein